MDTSTLPKVKCSILTAVDIIEATDCIANTFSKGEPMTSLLNISAEDFTYFANIFIKKSAQEGMSVIARDENTNQFLGCIICEDYVTDLPEGIENIHSSFGPIVALLEELGTIYHQNNAVNEGDVYHLFMGGVYPQFAGAGVANSMSLFLEKVAKEKGYKKAVGEVTGPISQHVYINKLDYSPLYNIKYHDFIFEGEAVFKDITACESCILIEKQL